MAALAERPEAASIEEFLAHEERKDLLRFFTAGSVDDGKSTLIGRLLYDSKGIYEDQLASIARSPVNRAGGGLDLSLLTDGLRAEREQGITIDVAYRYFSTPRRKFIIADTPGHEQYTRNMATGASTAELAIVLIDARYGVLPQTRRHAYIASLLGIPRLAVAVNKMDLMDYSESVFSSIREDFLLFAERLNAGEIRFFPISALVGDNVVERSPRMPWYTGGSLLEYLETVPVGGSRGAGSFRLPVQYVIRPDLDFRGYAGRIASGTLQPGDEVMALPSGRTSRVVSLPGFDGERGAAAAPESVTVVLADEIDLSRGDMLVDPRRPPAVSNQFDATLVWMNARPLLQGRNYLLKHTTQTVNARVTRLRHRVDIQMIEGKPAASLSLNEIGLAAMETSRPIYYDPYRANRATGAFILIDPLTNETVGAGMIEPRRDGEGSGLERVSADDRHQRNGHYAALVWAGVETASAWRLERLLFDKGCQAAVVENDPHAAQALEAAGLIVIATGGEAARERLRHAPRFHDVSAKGYPPERMLKILEENGVLSVAERFLSGEGI